MSTSKNPSEQEPIITEELFPAPKRKPLNHKASRTSAVLAIETVGLTGRDDANNVDRMEALNSLAFLAWQVNWCQDALVGKMRAEGTTWREIGAALDVTRSAAQQRFGG